MGSLATKNLTPREADEATKIDELLSKGDLGQQLSKLRKFTARSVGISHYSVAREIAEDIYEEVHEAKL